MCLVIIIIHMVCPAYKSCIFPSLHLPTSQSCTSIFSITPPEALGQKTSFSEVYFYYIVVLYCHLLYSTDKLEPSFQINVMLSS